MRVLNREYERRTSRALARQWHRHRSPVGEMSAPAPALEEAVSLAALCTGEMSVEDIPLPAGFDIAALKAGDDDPLEVVVTCSAGKSKRGLYYTRDALAKIAGEVNDGGLPGYEGHQKAEDVSTQFPDAVTHWVAAKQDGDTFYFRGVVDASAKKLKRLIRSKRITQTSIFGIPKLDHGRTKVVDYEPISIDWTPLKRAGMPTAIVALGEIDSITEPGRTAPEKEDSMTFAELMAALRSEKAEPAAVIGEMGWKAPDVIQALDLDLETVGKVIDEAGYTKITTEAGAYGEIAKIFGDDVKAEDIVTRVKAEHEAAGKATTAEHDKLVGEVLKDKVVGELAQTIVGEGLRLVGTEDKEAIEKAIGEVLERDHVKTTLRALKGIGPIAPPSGGKEGSNEHQGARTKKVRL